MATIYQQFGPEEAQFLSGAFPSYEKFYGTNFPVVGLCYDAATGENAYWHFIATQYNTGVLNLDLMWYADTALSGDIVWSAQVAAITPNSDTENIETKSFFAASTVTDTHLISDAQMLHQCSITVTGLDSMAADDAMWLKVTREATDGADTMIGDVVLTNLRLSYIGT